VNQIARFLEDPDGIIVCTDVIGHGINLPLAEVCFAETEKFDGHQRRSLRPWEAAQIAGRAGRFGLQSEGEVSVLKGINWCSPNHNIIRQAVEVAAGRQATGLVFNEVNLMPLPRDVKEIPKESFGKLAQGWEKVVVEHRGELPIHPFFSERAKENLTKLKQFVPVLGAQTTYSLAGLPIDNDELLMDLANTLASKKNGLVMKHQHHSVRKLNSDSIEAWENAAKTFRELATVCRSFDRVDGLILDELLDFEKEASKKIIGRILHTLKTNKIGKCAKCKKQCAPWYDTCSKCHEREYRDYFSEYYF
jgi:ATP-dependent RNA helicase SUPV3L1/SUV3